MRTSEIVSDAKKRKILAILQTHKGEMGKLMAQAGIHRGNLCRWRNGSGMTITRFEALCKVLKRDSLRLITEVESEERFSILQEYLGSRGSNPRMARVRKYLNLILCSHLDVFPKTVANIELVTRGDIERLRMKLTFPNRRVAEIVATPETSGIHLVLSYAPPNSMSPEFVLDTYAGGCDLKHILRHLRRFNDRAIIKVIPRGIPSASMEEGIHNFVQ